VQRDNSLLGALPTDFVPLAGAWCCLRLRSRLKAIRAMSTEPQRICPSCRNEFSRTMEFCPVCMLRQGLVSEDPYVIQKRPRSVLGFSRGGCLVN